MISQTISFPSCSTNCPLVAELEEEVQELKEGLSVIQTSDGGYALAGRTASKGGGREDFWVVKVDVDGEKEWNVAYGGPAFERGRSLIQTIDGDYVVAGTRYDYGKREVDAWLVKFNPNVRVFHFKIPWWVIAIAISIAVFVWKRKWG